MAKAAHAVLPMELGSSVCPSRRTGTPSRCGWQPTDVTSRLPASTEVTIEFRAATPLSPPSPTCFGVLNQSTGSARSRPPPTTRHRRH